MTSVPSIAAAPAQVTVVANPATKSPKIENASASVAAQSAGPAATLQLSQQAVAKLRAQATAQGDSDWRPGQKIDWA